MKVETKLMFLQLLQRNLINNKIWMWEAGAFLTSGKNGQKACAPRLDNVLSVLTVNLSGDLLSNSSSYLCRW